MQSLRPPTVLHKLGLIPTGFAWRVHRAIYGLKEAPSLWLQERTKVMELPYAALSQRVQPQDVLALCGIYVDDYLSVGPHDIVTSFLEHLRSVWKTTDQCI